MVVDKDVEKKLTELLVACNVTMFPRGIARALIAAGVTVDPNLKHCYQCKNFIGGGDWNLCCKVTHPTPNEKEQGLKFEFGHLCYKETNACDMFEENTNETENI